ncbi:MAG: Dolichol-phosphate mannosyltransferase in lipid-linked oligosaccharide synthesis cluster [Acidobacteria bacterium]|nr:Dolichol-phosphate mannosyltransferase in lipid-linked oligosaccharide synthesis cluster [Acidobacteriota bacterium]
MNPLVTVALPVYNGERFLEAAIAALRNQTYANLDIVLCDNASTDRTAEICAAAAAADPRIRSFRHRTNLGPNGNFIFGLQQKRGDYFMWAAHDDEKAPEFVAEAVAALQRNPAAVLACSWTTIVTREAERVHRPYSPAIASGRIEERLQAFIADTQCVAFYGLFRSTMLDAIGVPDEWLDNDRRYLFRAAIRGPFEVIPRALFRFRMFNTLDDYLRMGFRMRPGAADFDLDLYRQLPRLLREAGVGEEDVRGSMESMMVPLRPYLQNRANFLIGRLLASTEPRKTKLARLAAWARQYPPLMRGRLFWGAARRVLLATKAMDGSHA